MVAAAINEKGSAVSVEEAEDPSIEDGCGLENGTTIAITGLKGFWCHTPAAEAESLRQRMKGCCSRHHQQLLRCHPGCLGVVGLVRRGEVERRAGLGWPHLPPPSEGMEGDHPLRRLLRCRVRGWRR